MQLAPARSRTLAEFKRRLAAVLARSGLDYTDYILILNAFLRDFRWEEKVGLARIRSHWKNLLSGGLPPGHRFSLYIHVPYCSKKCLFCYCPTEITPDDGVIDRYVPELKQELEEFSPLLGRLPVDLLQVGGGTPSLLSAERLKELFDAIGERFTLAPDGQRTIEFNPASATPEKIAAARRAGFNRISFGVQSLNAEVLERENREYQTREMTIDSLRWAREAGFETINVDLLLGLSGESAESFLEGFAAVADLHPTTITVSALSLTDAYVKVMGATREVKLREHDKLVPVALKGMTERAASAGYTAADPTPGHAYWIFLSKHIDSAAFARMAKTDHFSGGTMSILGLGRQAFSHAYGRAFYERYPLRFSASEPIYRQVRSSVKEEMMRYILSALEVGSRIDSVDFRRRFETDLQSAFSLELRALAAFGKIKIDARGVSFLPERAPERIFYGLVFLLDALPDFASTGEGALFRARLEETLSDVTLSERA